MSVGQRVLQPDGRFCSDASHIVKPIKTISVTTSRARTLSLKIPTPLFSLSPSKERSRRSLLAHNCKMVRNLRMIVATTDSGRLESE
jgi:hypothetical protein